MRQQELREHVQTQTSFSDSESSFEYEPDKVSLRSVLHRMSSIFHSYLGGGGLSRQGSRRGDTPSPIGSVASGDFSRQNSTRRRTTGGNSSANNNRNRNSTLLDVLVPGGGSRRSSIWSLGTMVVSAQVGQQSIPFLVLGSNQSTL